MFACSETDSVRNRYPVDYGADSNISTDSTESRQAQYLKDYMRQVGIVHVLI